MTRIDTKDSLGRPNGWVMPVWSALLNPELRPEQIYITAIAPRTRKGPHLHMKRRGLFKVVSGRVTLVLRIEGRYSEHELDLDSRPFVVDPGVACAIYNPGSFSAILLNMPSPAWSKEDPDEHMVEDWKDPDWWHL